MKRQKEIEALLSISTGCLLLYFIYDKQAFVVIALTLGVIGLIPNKLGWAIARLWYWFSEILGAVVPKLLLAIVFYLLLYPIAVFSRLFTKDPLRLSRQYESYYYQRDTTCCPADFEKTW
jgi:hypothetical protein